MTSNKELRERLRKKSEECQKYRKLYEELMLHQDETEGKRAKDNVKRIENTISMMTSAITSLQGLLGELKHVPLPKLERDRLRKNVGLARLSSGPSLSKIRKPTAKFAQSAVRMPALSLQKHRNASDNEDDENAEDDEEEQDSSMDEEDEDNGAQSADLQYQPVMPGGLQAASYNNGNANVYGQQQTHSYQGAQYYMPGPSQAQHAGQTQFQYDHGWQHLAHYYNYGQDVPAGSMDQPQQP